VRTCICTKEPNPLKLPRGCRLEFGVETTTHRRVRVSGPVRHGLQFWVKLSGNRVGISGEDFNKYFRAFEGDADGKW